MKSCNFVSSCSKWLVTMPTISASMVGPLAAPSQNTMIILDMLDLVLVILETIY